MKFLLSREEFEKEKDVLKNRIKDGAVFIYPTDTIYGMGCDASNEKAVEKIRHIKHRNNNPFSVIAPSKEWINENCMVNGNAKPWVRRLPGPYTLIMKVKNKHIAENAAPELDSLGIRIPDHWFSDFVNEINMPIVSTSANLSGQDFMTSLEDLNEEVKSKVDFIIYEGIKEGKPSRIVDLTEKTKVIER